MSVGTKLLTKLIVENSIANLIQVSDDYFTEDELPTFECIVAYHRQFGRLPSMAALAESGYPLSDEVEDEFGYYLQRARERAIYNAINARHPAFTQAMRNGDATEAVEALTGMLSAARSIRNPLEFTTLISEAAEVRRKYEEVKRNPGNVGLPFGWPTIDRITLGMQPADIVVMVGRPGTGKTYTMLWSAIQNWLLGNSVLFVSMEMTVEQIVRRWISICSRISTRYIRRGELSTWAENTMFETISGFEGTAPVTFMAGDLHKTVGDVQDAVRYFNPDAVYVDAAYLLGTTLKFKSPQARWEKVADVVEQLKSSATRTLKPHAISVQFNRDRKKHSSSRMDLSEIAGADAIPQIASVVLGIRMGPEPFTKTRRVIEGIKVRDAEDEFAVTINYRFAPVDFSEVSPEEAESAEGGGTGWMV